MMHKGCFKCATCQIQLTISNTIDMGEGELLCRSHASQKKMANSSLSASPTLTPHAPAETITTASLPAPAVQDNDKDLESMIAKLKEMHAQEIVQIKTANAAEIETMKHQITVLVHKAAVADHLGAADSEDESNASSPTSEKHQGSASPGSGSASPTSPSGRHRSPSTKRRNQAQRRFERQLAHSAKSITELEEQLAACNAAKAA